MMFAGVRPASLSEKDVATLAGLLSGVPTPWASRPSAAAAGAGALKLFDFGAGAVIMRSDGINWRLLSFSDVIDNTTTVAGVGSTAEQIIKQVAVPAGLLMSLRGFSLSYMASKAGGNGVVTQVQMRLGTTGTTADTQVYTTGSWSSAGNLVNSGGRLLRATSATTLRVYNASPNTPLEAVGAATSWPIDMTIADSNANDLILSLTVTAASASDTPSGQRLTLMGW